jgi:hypothetical protein
MISILPRITKWTEILGIILSVTGYGLKILHYAGADELLLVGLLTLATTYFLSAFMLVPLPDNHESKTFTDLLPTILRKVMYIALAVSLNGFLFAILHLAGADQMLRVGITTLVSGVSVSMVLTLGNRERMTLLKGPLIRSVVVLLIFLISYLR